MKANGSNEWNSNNEFHGERRETVEKMSMYELKHSKNKRMNEMEWKKNAQQLQHFELIFILA